MATKPLTDERLETLRMIRNQAPGRINIDIHGDIPGECDDLYEAAHRDLPSLVAEVRASRSRAAPLDPPDAGQGAQCGNRACEYHGECVPALHPTAPRSPASGETTPDLARIEGRIDKLTASAFADGIVAAGVEAETKSGEIICDPSSVTEDAKAALLSAVRALAEERDEARRLTREANENADAILDALERARDGQAAPSPREEGLREEVERLAKEWEDVALYLTQKCDHGVGAHARAQECRKHASALRAALAGSRPEGPDAFGTCPAKRGVFNCTLPPGHEGDHIAQGAPGQECERWSRPEGDGGALAPESPAPEGSEGGGTEGA